MKTTLRTLFAEAMLANGETFDDALRIRVDSDLDAEFDNDFGRMEGGNGFGLTPKGFYATADQRGKRLVIGHPATAAEGLIDRELGEDDGTAYLEKLTKKFLTAVRENFGDDAFTEVSEALHAAIEKATKPKKPDEPNEPAKAEETNKVKEPENAAVTEPKKPHGGRRKAQ